MKNTKLIFGTIAVIAFFCVSDLAYNFFTDHTRQFLRKYGDADFSEFRGTSFTAQGGRNNHVHCYGAYNSITNGVIWFDIHRDTFEFAYHDYSPRFTPNEGSVTGEEKKFLVMLTEEEKTFLMTLKPLFPTFVKYRVRQLTVDDKGNIYVGIGLLDTLRLIKPTAGGSVPEVYQNQVIRKIDDWYLLKENTSNQHMDFTVKTPVD